MIAFNVRFFSLTLSLLLGHVAIASDRAGNFAGLKVEVSLAASQQSPTVQFKISNATTNTIECHRADLPWASRHSIILMLVENDISHTVVPEELPVDDPITGTLKISPGGDLEGNLILRSRFPELQKALARREVILFWSYQLKPLNSPVLPRCGGWILIPKAQD